MSGLDAQTIILALALGFDVYKYFDGKKKKPPGSPDSSNR